MQDDVVRMKVLAHDHTHRFQGTLKEVRWRSESEHARYQKSGVRCVLFRKGGAHNEEGTC